MSLRDSVGALWLAVALLACDGTEDTNPSDDSECAEVPSYSFASGTYRANAGEPVDWYCDDCGVVFPPHAEVDSLSLQLDSERETVTISYVRDGVNIVERWSVAVEAR